MGYYSWDSFDVGEEFLGGLIKKNKKKFKSSFKKSYSDLEKKIEMTKQVVNHAKRNKWNEVELIWNIFGFILLTSYDLKIAGERLILENSPRIKKYFVQQLCILFSEVIQDINQLLGKNFFVALDKMIIPEEKLANIKNAKKEFSRLTEVYKKDLASIRNFVGAHKEHDFLKQIEVIDFINPNKFMKLMSEFDDALNKLADAMSPLYQLMEVFVAKKYK